MQIPFALSLSKYLNSAGGDAGFASILAVALLVILYFAHARETRTLREHLDEAHDRIDALEARVAQLLQLQAARPQQPQAPVAQRPAVVPPPAAGATRPMGSAVASLRQVPAGAGADPGQEDPIPAAPYGVAAPALMSATNALPEAPAVAPARVAAATTAISDDTMMVAPAAAGAAGNGGRVAAGRAFAAPIPVPAAAAATAVGRDGPRAAPAGAPPRVQIRPEAPSGTVPRRSAQQPPRGSLLDDSRSGGGRGRRILGALGAVIAIVVIVVVLTKLTSSGTTTNSSASHSAKKTKSGKSGAFDAHNVTVAVLNGTSVAGLAKDVSQVLSKQGYRQGNITNAAVQTQKSTIVYYIPGQQVAAQHVATAMKLKASDVKLASQSVIQSCSATPVSASGANTCQGDVIVSVGADRSSLASGTQSG